MNQFLLQPDAAFYHVTPFSNWESIQADGALYGRDNKIFVCRSADRAIHQFIANTQVPEINIEGRYATLRLPVHLNHFNARDFKADFQSNEITMPFHSILIRDHIPLTQIELVEVVDVNNAERVRESNALIGTLWASGEFEAALQTEYTYGQGALYHVGYEGDESNWKFVRRF